MKPSEIIDKLVEKVINLARQEDEYLTEREIKLEVKGWILDNNISIKED